MATSTSSVEISENVSLLIKKMEATNATDNAHTIFIYSVLIPNL